MIDFDRDPMTAMEESSLVLIGYFLRRTALPQGWPLPENVTEICSVSDCINPSPENWIQRWIHNELGFFDTRQDARTMQTDLPGEYQLLAYRLLPRRFIMGHEEAIELPELEVEPLSSDFASLGFDVVSKSMSDFFECSPLSCNALAEEVPVNPYCLLDSLSEAISLALRCSKEEPEPGPYFALEVLRHG